MRWLLGLGVVAHGLVHVAIWLAPAGEGAPFDVRHSRLFGDLGALATSAGVLAGAGFVMAGSALLSGVSWWPPVLAVAAAVSTALLLLTFTRWWLFALAINVALVLFAIQEVPST